MREKIKEGFSKGYSKEGREGGEGLAVGVGVGGECLCEVEGVVMYVRIINP